MEHATLADTVLTDASADGSDSASDSAASRADHSAASRADTVVVLNGPNLNLLGEREPEIYGATTLADVEALCREAAEAAGLVADCRQSNHEGTLIDWVQEGRRGIAGIVLNAGGYTHTSVALRDAVSACQVPVVEVHISDIHAREPFRHHSFLTDVTAHQVIGRGVAGYPEAIAWIAAQRTHQADSTDLDA